MSEIDCERVLAELEVFLDGELPDERARVIEAHISECTTPCARRREFVVRVREIVRRKVGTTPVPPALDDRIRGVLGLR